MNAEERSLLPPPPKCMQCNSLQTLERGNVKRQWCNRGYVMHDDCGYFRPRTPAIDGKNPHVPDT